MDELFLGLEPWEHFLIFAQLTGWRIFDEVPEEGAGSASVHI